MGIFFCESIAKANKQTNIFYLSFPFLCFLANVWHNHSPFWKFLAFHNTNLTFGVIVTHVLNKRPGNEYLLKNLFSCAFGSVQFEVVYIFKMLLEEKSSSEVFPVFFRFFPVLV